MNTGFSASSCHVSDRSSEDGIRVLVEEGARYLEGSSSDVELNCGGVVVGHVVCEVRMFVVGWILSEIFR
jgi:hypothetical protein